LLPRLKTLADYVTTHFNERPTLARGAKVAGLEKKYFSACFRSKVGISWTE